MQPVWARWTIGMLRLVAAWAFFRNPGQRWFVVAPITRASRFLTPAGVALWIDGLITAAVGVVDFIGCALRVW